MSTKEKDAKAGKTILSNLLLTKMLHIFQTTKRGGKRRIARGGKQQQGLFHWHKRIIKEMHQNKTIQAKILDGSFDRYLES